MPGLPRRPPPPDQGDREAAVRETRRNVLIDAGAGTGKTTTLVRRLIERLAPSDGGPALTIGRIAAVTFTRRAAGELRLRIRERLLAELASPDLPAARRSRLQGCVVRYWCSRTYVRGRRPGRPSGQSPGRSRSSSMRTAK